MEGSSQSPSDGLLASMWSSLKLHFDERSASPFAGAFAISWLAVNWQQVLILAFSEASIEQRITAVLPHFGWEQTLGRPLVLAAIFAAGYYIAATIFVALSEAYRLGAGKVRRLFEKREWVPAPRFALFKARYLEKIEALSLLAADNTDELRKTQSDAAEAILALEKEKVESQKARSERDIEKLRAMALINEKGEFEVQASELRSELERIGSSVLGMKSNIAPVESSLRERAATLASLAQSLEEMAKESENVNALARIERPGALLRRSQSLIQVAEIVKDVANRLDNAREKLVLTMRL